MATFITSKAVGQDITISVETSTGFWKYNHDGVDSSVFANGSQTITVENANGEFTLISCDDQGNVSGNLTVLDLDSDQITSFDGTGLSALTQLDLDNNQLTSFDGTDLSALTYLILNNNQLTSFDGTDLTALNTLSLTGNQLTTIAGFIFPTSLTDLYLGASKDNLNYLTSVDLSALVNLMYLNLELNQLTSFVGTGLSALTTLELNNNQLTSFDGTDLSTLTDLYLANNQLTSFDSTGLSALTQLDLSGNQLTTIDITGLNVLRYLGVNDNLLTPTVNNALLAKLAANEAANDWDTGEFYTTGGRTAAGTTDYDYLIANGWTVEGADLVPTGTGKLRVKGIGQLNP